ncbi:acyl-CoA carboxylase subunit epsilon [Nocardia sp. NPDC003963]
MSAVTAGPFLRVEKGSADPEEIAALATLLHARRHLARPPARARTGARWRRLERRPAFTDPRAWSSTTR